ncbi:ABC transporter substrate-binding protein [Mariprofundus sp. KV]|uniref:ABC transporter substrate-binding protein n=1 Tax=Mariprofundus sp. KV TaxID=2608715 RepID=UPI0015A48131|nr:ABC transporter substrate-binding protein [Mariprofundus sp. KV]NWF37088.1 hypothetical protein [Mariprofundus sp. KV]
MQHKPGWFLALTVMFLMTACSQERPLTVAMHPWLGYQSMPLAQQEGWISRDRVTLIHTKSSTFSMQKMSSGEVDAAALTLDEAIQLRSQGADVSVILIFDISSGADVVLARFEMEKLIAQSEITIGIESNALGTLMFAKFIEISGLDRSKFRIINVTADQHESFWNQKGADMLITYEPMASALIKKGAIRVTDTRSMADAVFDVLVVRNDVMKSMDSALLHLLQGHFKALQHIHGNRNDAYYRLAALTGMSKTEVSEFYNGMILPNLDYNVELAAGSPGRLQDYSERLGQLLKREGFLVSHDTSGLVKSEYLTRLMRRE